MMADIPQQVAAVPGDGSVVLTWEAARDALSHNVYLAAEPGVPRSNWQQKPEGRRFEDVPFTSPIWRQELHLQCRHWCQRLNNHLGKNIIEEVVFR